VEVEAMSEVDVVVWLTCGYAVFLLLTAYGLDLMAKRTSRHTADWRSGSFTYHEDHDAWVCPEDQWLWPQSFDPDNRVMRYRANSTVCNSCPVKDSCTTSDSGREISRNVDPWPHSEAGRFHRGMACSVAILAILLPLFTMIGNSALEFGCVGGGCRARGASQLALVVAPASHPGGVSRACARREGRRAGPDRDPAGVTRAHRSLHHPVEWARSTHLGCGFTV
jgi:hypothetical protein